MLRELLALVAPERESLDRVQVYIPHAGRAPTLFFAVQNAPGSLLGGATRTRATWSRFIFCSTKCARVLAGRRNKDPCHVAPPYFLSHGMRAGPCCLGKFQKVKQF